MRMRLNMPTSGHLDPTPSRVINLSACAAPWAIPAEFLAGGETRICQLGRSATGQRANVSKGEPATEQPLHGNAQTQLAAYSEPSNGQ